jgi:hypothetical protein
MRDNDRVPKSDGIDPAIATPEIDILGAIRSNFETECVRGYHLGSLCIACGARPRVIQQAVDRA